MHKHYIERILLRSVYILLLIVSCFMGCSKKIVDKMIDINELAHANNFEQIVKDYSTVDLCKLSAPKELALYISALVETETSLPVLLNNASCPAHIREFSMGYFDLLHGKSHDAVIHFSLLRGNVKEALWSSIAILDYSLYADDFSGYESALEILKGIESYQQDTKTNYLKKGVLPYYEGWYLLTTGKLTELRRFLIERGSELDPYDKTILKVELDIREDKFEEATTALKQMIAMYPVNQELRTMNGEIIRVTQGDRAWLQYLKKMLNDHPKMWLIEAHYAASLIEANNKEEGLSLLEKIARKRPFDYKIKLLNEDYAFHYGSDSQKAQVLKTISNEQYIQFPYYHVVGSKIYYTQGDLMNTEKQLALAKRLNPYADSVLWLEFDVLNRSKRSKEAAAVLDRLLSLKPNDIEALYERLILAINMGETSKAKEIESRLSITKRHRPSKYINEIEMLKKTGRS